MRPRATGPRALDLFFTACATLAGCAFVAGVQATGFAGPMGKALAFGIGAPPPLVAEALRAPGAGLVTEAVGVRSVRCTWCTATAAENTIASSADGRLVAWAACPKHHALYRAQLATLVDPWEVDRGLHFGKPYSWTPAPAVAP